MTERNGQVCITNSETATPIDPTSNKHKPFTLQPQQLAAESSATTLHAMDAQPRVECESSLDGKDSPLITPLAHTMIRP